MNDSPASEQLARHLELCDHLQRRRIRELNDIAQGVNEADPEVWGRVTAAERRIAAQLDNLSHGVTTRLRVVSEDEWAGGREALPAALIEAYEQLFIRAYGSNGAVSIGDATVIRGIGRREARTSTGTPEGRGGAAPPATKKFGSSRRNTIKDQRAYQLKINIDRRLRRIAREIAEDLEDISQRETAVNTCSRCARIGEEEWGWCPHCGHEMKLLARES
jgi:hypothetical protein